MELKQQLFSPQEEKFNFLYCNSGKIRKMKSYSKTNALLKKKHAKIDKKSEKKSIFVEKNFGTGK
jgi:hypothetical protein